MGWEEVVSEQASLVTRPSFHSRKRVFRIAGNPSLEGLVHFARFEGGLRIGAISCQSGARKEDGTQGNTTDRSVFQNGHGKRALIAVSYFYRRQTTDPHQNNLDFGPHVNRDE